MPTTIVWFRRDLRLSDHPALTHAAQRGEIVPVYVLEPSDGEFTGPRAASRYWLHHSLKALGASLGALVLRRGDAQEVLMALAKETGADAVYWNRRYTPRGIEEDMGVKSALQAKGLDVQSFNASLLHEPWQVQTGSGGPYKVFTPFWRTIKTRDPGAPLSAPQRLRIRPDIASDNLAEWRLLPTRPNWAKGWEDIWQIGEMAAQQCLEDFVATNLNAYGTRRDLPHIAGTSRLSPHLHFGEISPRQIWARVQHQGAMQPKITSDAEKFLSELAWREFSYHLLFHFPDLPTKNWKIRFDRFPWRTDDNALEAWQKGQTGYPLVDAGMRELWATGYMHNRVRMITASFLIKHLRIDWREGERWFWDCLVDADLANNAAAWQWVAGSGADASPFFRIFNPIAQGQRFDPEGQYIRRWCPELADLPDKFVHAPWEAPSEVLETAGVSIGTNYPKPMVNHAKARQATLAAYAAISTPD